MKTQFSTEQVMASLEAAIEVGAEGADDKYPCAHMTRCAINFHVPWVIDITLDNGAQYELILKKVGAETQ